MTNDSGADRAGRASPRAEKSSRPFGDHHGERAKARIAKGDKWRSALIAFYERDECKQKARNLRNGAPLDYLDLRTIEALEAAFIHAAVAA